MARRKVWINLLTLSIFRMILKTDAEMYRAQLIEAVAEYDENLGEIF